MNEWLPEAIKVLQTLEPPCGLPIYTSMDIRDSGCKVCAVDVNLFPAGFNNLNAEEKYKAAEKMRLFFSAKILKASPWCICLIPEAHTNNQGYLENLTGIIEILNLAGAQVKLMWSGMPIPQAWTITTKSGKNLVFLPQNQALENVDAILLNHDLSGGVLESIKDIHLPIFPSPTLGWYKRKKSSHFEIVDALLEKIANAVKGFDKWCFQPLTLSYTNLNFDQEKDVEFITQELQKIFHRLRAEYAERGYSQEPFLFLKNDAGTYGMGVLSFKDIEEVEQAASLIRKKLRKGKESVPIRNVIIQEGIVSHYHLKNKEESIAEPVLYMVNGMPVGGFFRAHSNLGDKGPFENLNQPGSTLQSLDIDYSSPRELSIRELMEAPHLYYFLAKLHATAAALEECPQ